MKKIFTLGWVLIGFSFSAWAQSASVNYVTEVITSYRGYWRSGNGTSGSAARDSVRPDNSHNLLAFRANDITYSTGVDDALLTSKGISFTTGRFQALPVASIGAAPTPNTKIALGQLYDKVDKGPSNPAPSGTLASYLIDGPQGLDIGTGVANLPAGNLTFSVGNVQGTAIGGAPDILVTQIADPANSQDTYSFLNANDQIVGNAVTVTYDNVTFPTVGNWIADFYEASTTPYSITAGFTKTPRPIRLWAADLSRFGITATNYSQIAKFRVTLSGNSDVAFVAYNTQSVTVLPVVLTSFTGNALANGQVRLHWQTASEVNSDAFVVEASTDGQTFVPVGRVAAAGDKTSASNYAYLHQPATTGLVYYRLHQLDRDGTSAYSPVVAVNQRGRVPLLVQMAPNPFSEILRLQLPTAATGEVQLLSLEGKVLQQHTLTDSELNAGTCTLGGLSTLQPGMYLLQSTLDGQRTTQKAVKQ